MRSARAVPPCLAGGLTSAWHWPGSTPTAATQPGSGRYTRPAATSRSARSSAKRHVHENQRRSSRSGRRLPRRRRRRRGGRRRPGRLSARRRADPSGRPRNARARGGRRPLRSARAEGGPPRALRRPSPSSTRRSSGVDGPASARWSSTRAQSTASSRMRSISARTIGSSKAAVRPSQVGVLPRWIFTAARPGRSASSANSTATSCAATRRSRRRPACTAPRGRPERATGAPTGRAGQQPAVERERPLPRRASPSARSGVSLHANARRSWSSARDSVRLRTRRGSWPGASPGRPRRRAGRPGRRSRPCRRPPA